MAELKATLEADDADLVLAATPIDLRSLLELDEPVKLFAMSWSRPAAGPWRTSWQRRSRASER